MRIWLSCVSLLSLPALAHFELDSPVRRHPETNFNKPEPCGSATNERTTDASRITTFTAGTELTLEWQETIGHAGRWRIAFDAEGSDSVDFLATEMAVVVDPPGSDGNIGDGSRWRATVLLPDTPCSNCTLQVQQIMTDSLEPAPGSIYSECADIVLVAPGAVEGEGEGQEPVGEGEGDAAEGEGEGAAPPIGEGEGETSAAEGEGETAEGEGDTGLPDEGTDMPCGTGAAALPLSLLLAVRRRR
jgi:hypothetical protein